MIKQMETNGMWWNYEEVHMSKWKWQREIWRSRWKEVITKGKWVSRPMMWKGWVIIGKETMSPKRKKIVVNHNRLISWWFFWLYIFICLVDILFNPDTKSCPIDLWFVYKTFLVVSQMLMYSSCCSRMCINVVWFICQFETIVDYKSCEYYGALQSTM